MLNSYLTPNQMMLLGAVIAASPVVASNVKVQAWAKEHLSGLGSLIQQLNPFKSRKPVPDVAPSPAGVVIDSPLAVHQVVTPLMAFFARNQDDVGVQLAGAVGQHMYEHSAKWMAAPHLAAVKTSD